MKCLGIESTAHTFGISIVTEKGKILSNEKNTYTTKSGGMIPRELTEHHYSCAKKVIDKALATAGVTMKDIDLISYSQGPGIGNSLRVGAITARQLSLLFNIPIIGVNHCVAHVEIGRKLCDAADPVMLYASGANTQIICFENNYYRVFGETLDTGIGNFLDTFGRKIGMGFPAGPELDKLYYKGKELIEMPYTVKGMDLAFSGLLTSAINKFNKVKGNKQKENDIIYSTLHTAFAMLTEVTERALAHTEKKQVILGGGVGCSKPLQEMVSKMCEERGAKLFVPPNSTMIDNGIMIGWLGILMHKNGYRTPINSSQIKPKQRTDDIKVIWR
ncbi:MAG: N(6)-L-threonylcarbamoyladenine synthase Kae1 [Candidatus Diapherotrites archaeon]|jgi:N6-L-threonylcarbamoyladenine synthase|uniref:tRNA N6-adenosine threonylcarbamoyltransferase n=1 Tax=Candidatus Iainarchaeum sp. TaxID=3101447 RepID=A0A8T5GFU3_9ARCH|nr:N(6)-L-threonylcarbamoyladenine synthase Kae1 [Candidatus Diapherotrites archaeon]MBT7241323.1 N(6)-L-threonylcarbamoyladenine synthase Kae1 [Candidatus Diapherotrites archaeon]